MPKPSESLNPPFSKQADGLWWLYWKGEWCVCHVEFTKTERQGADHLLVSIFTSTGGLNVQTMFLPHLAMYHFQGRVVKPTAKPPKS